MRNPFMNNRLDIWTIIKRYNFKILNNPTTFGNGYTWRGMHRSGKFVAKIIQNIEK